MHSSILATSLTVAEKPAQSSLKIWVSGSIQKRRSSVNFTGQDIFARKYMREKINKIPEF